MREDITASTASHAIDGASARVNFRRGAKLHGLALCFKIGARRTERRVDGKIMIEDRNNVLLSPDQTSDRNVRISPSELRSLLDSFHERLDAFFEEMRSLPEATARQKAGNSRSLMSE